MPLDFHKLPQLPPDRRWRGQGQPLPVVVALLRGEKETKRCFLLIQRNSETYGGQWALVGGKWDFGETVAAAISREVKEETGLTAKFISVLGIVNERLAPTREHEIGAHFLIFVCLLEVVDGVACEQHEGAVGWFTWSEINELNRRQKIIPSDYAMLQHFGEAAAGAPHYEVEMVAAIGTDQDNDARLLRFERIG